jgi:hypothetical protein
MGSAGRCGVRCIGNVPHSAHDDRRVERVLRLAQLVAVSFFAFCISKVGSSATRGGWQQVGGGRRDNRSPGSGCLTKRLPDAINVSDRAGQQRHVSDERTRNAQAPGSGERAVTWHQPRGQMGPVPVQVDPRAVLSCPPKPHHLRRWDPFGTQESRAKTRLEGPSKTFCALIGTQCPQQWVSGQLTGPSSCAGTMSHPPCALGSRRSAPQAAGTSWAPGGRLGAGPCASTEGAEEGAEWAAPAQPRGLPGPPWDRQRNGKPRGEALSGRATRETSWGIKGHQSRWYGPPSHR